MTAVSPTRVIGGRYVVLAELGRGGMGVVWRAEDRVMGRHVAVKELHLPSGLSKQERLQFRERLLREARTAGRLNHPGVVTVYDVITDDGVDHIVMELIEASTLAEVVASSGPLDERAATSVARQLLAALGAAHDNGVVHRDVKPNNVMLGEGGRVKLTDFGIAQAADDPRLTTTGSLIGSPGYLAPERLEGAPATPASDLWGLGATLFHAVEGVGPFARETTAATISAVLHADVPLTRARGPLRAVISGLLQREPQARLAGPQAAALLASSGAPVRPGTDPDDPTRPVTDGPTDRLTGGLAGATRGRRLWIGAAVLVAGLVIGAVGGYGLAKLRAQPDVAVLTYGYGGDMPEVEVTDGRCYLVAPAAGKVVDSGAYRDCADRYESQVFGVFDTVGPSRELAYPGKAQLGAFGTAACELLFDSDLIVGSDKARLAITTLVPSAGAFGRDTSSPGSTPSFTEREVYCVLRAADGSLLEGSRIRPESG